MGAVKKIESEYDLPERGQFLRFKTSQHGKWIHGMFAEWEPLRFVEGDDDFDPNAKTYPWNKAYEYQSYPLSPEEL